MAMREAERSGISMSGPRGGCARPDAAIRAREKA
jgi:hypothetical protein